MIEILDKESGALLGEVTEQQLEFLITQLEEEYDEDRDYYIDARTIEMLEKNGVSADLVDLLRLSMGDADGMEIQWRRRA